MKTLEYSFKDKTKWGEGPWQHEPDKLQWMDEATRMPCLIVRNNGGALCGYVGVGKSHPWFQKHYNEVPVDVHGGLTYADFCRESDDNHGICHLVEPGDDDHVWWLGFDCAHAGDQSPAYKEWGMNYYHPGYERYRDMDYVRGQCQFLARQLKELGDGKVEAGSEGSSVAPEGGRAHSGGTEAV